MAKTRNYKNINKWIAKLKKRTIYVYLPKFKLTQIEELKRNLSKIDRLFSKLQH